MANILVVDDEKPIRSLLIAMLGKDGHVVHEAENGKQAVELFHQSPVDLVITDLVMPEKNGIDVIMELKGEYPNVQIVAISGGGGITGSFDYLPIAKLVGAITVLNKPFTLSDVRAAVSKAIGKG
jgi:two-component system response regulator (stage 0 sporulation protein F)